MTWKSTSFCQTPSLHKGGINDWPAVKFGEDEWCDIFGNKQLTFRSGSTEFRKEPYWERACTKKEMTLSEFFQLSKNKMCKDWFYFDYRNLEEVFPESDDILKAINWSSLGIPAVTKKSSTIWIGNKGASTPCHMDTYGVNFVAQLLGKKEWILMPPDQMAYLRPTRVPYEESSVYSRINFSMPTSEILEIKKLYRVILEPGDVLFVPRHWWHYVENIDVAISLNTWIPIAEDDESRLEEVIVQRIVVALCQDLTLNDAQQIVNPNEDSILTEEPSEDIMKTAVRNCQIFRNKEVEAAAHPVVFGKSGNFSPLKPLFAEEVNEWLEQKIISYNYSLNDRFTVRPTSDSLSTIKSVINAVCHPEVVNLAKEKLLSELNKI